MWNHQKNSFNILNKAYIVHSAVKLYMALLNTYNYTYFGRSESLILKNSMKSRDRVSNKKYISATSGQKCLKQKRKRRTFSIHHYADSVFWALIDWTWVFIPQHVTIKHPKHQQKKITFVSCSEAFYSNFPRKTSGM